MIDSVHEPPLANYSPASRASVISLGTEDDLEAMAALMAPAFTDLSFTPSLANLSLYDNHNPHHTVDASSATAASSSTVWEHAEVDYDNDDQVSLIYDDYAREPATPRTVIQGATPPISPSVFSHADTIDLYDERRSSSQQQITFTQTNFPHNRHSGSTLSPPACSPRRMASQPSMRSMNSYYSSVSASSSGSASSSSSSSILPSSHGANASSSSLSSLTRASYSPPASPCVIETPVDTTFAGAQHHVHIPGALSIIREADAASLVEVDGIVDYPFEEPYDLEALPSAYAPSFPYYSSAPPTPRGTGYPGAAAAPVASSTGKSSRSKSHAQEIGLRLQASGVVSSVPPPATTVVPPYHHPTAATTPQRSQSYPVPTAAGMTMTTAAYSQVLPPPAQVHRTRAEMESLVPPVPQTAPPQTTAMPIALSSSSPHASSPRMHAHALPAVMERRPSQASEAVLLNRNPSMTSLATTSATATPIGRTATIAETASIASSSGSSRGRQSRVSYATMQPSPLSTPDLSSSPAITPVSAPPVTRPRTTSSSTKKGLSFSRLMGSRSSVSSEKTLSSSSALKHKSFTGGLSIKTGRPSSAGSVSSSSDYSGGPSSAPVDRTPTLTSSSSTNLNSLDAKARKAELKRARKAEMERLAAELAAKQRQRKADSDRTSVHSGKSGERKRRQWEDQKAMYDGLGTVVL